MQLYFRLCIFKIHFSILAHPSQRFKRAFSEQNLSVVVKFSHFGLSSWTTVPISTKFSTRQSWIKKNSFFFNLGLSILIIPPQTCGLSVRSFVRPSPSLIRYSSKTAKQNFVKLSGIVHYMMPYCTYFKFLSAWFWGFPEQNKEFAITTYGGTHL